MNEWHAEFETRTRDDVMKVCALLAKGIGAEQASSRRIKVIVDGEFSGGKAAIVDGLTAALADGMRSYRLAAQSLYEKQDSEAQGQVLRRDFNCLQTPIINTFYHEHHNRGERPEAQIQDSPGVDFETYLMLLKPVDEPHLRVNFTYGSEMPKKEWSRKWVLQVADPDLQTPEMAEILDHLHSFHQRRQARVLENGWPSAGTAPDVLSV